MGIRIVHCTPLGDKGHFLPSSFKPPSLTISPPSFPFLSSRSPTRRDVHVCMTRVHASPPTLSFPFLRVEGGQFRTALLKLQFNAHMCLILIMWQLKIID